MQGMMKNKPGPAAPPFFSLKYPDYFHRELYSVRYWPSESEEDGPLILGDDADTEEDGDWKGEDDEDDREDDQENGATVSTGVWFLIVTNSHDL